MHSVITCQPALRSYIASVERVHFVCSGSPARIGGDPATHAVGRKATVIRTKRERQTPRPAAREARQRSRQRLISERSLPSPPRENSKPTFAETSGPIDSRRRQRFHGHSILLRSLFNSLSWTRVHAPPPQVAITSRSNAAFDCHQLIELPDARRIGRQDPLNDALTRARPPPRKLDRADAAPRPRSPRQPRRAEAAGSTTGGP